VTLYIVAGVAFVIAVVVCWRQASESDRREG